MKLSEFQSAALAVLRQMPKIHYRSEYKQAASDIDNYLLLTSENLEIFIYIDQFDIFKNGKLFDKVEFQDVDDKDDLIKCFFVSMATVVS